RDYYVEIARRGVAYPYKHRFLYVKISERKLAKPDGDVAYLWQRHLVMPVEATRSYTELVDPINAVLRAMPVESITFLDKVVQIDPPPDADNLTFVPSVNGVPVRFAVEAIDRDHNHHQLHVPLDWVPVQD